MVTKQTPGPMTPQAIHQVLASLRKACQEANSLSTPAELLEAKQAIAKALAKLPAGARPDGEALARRTLAVIESLQEPQRPPAPIGQPTITLAPGGTSVFLTSIYGNTLELNSFADILRFLQVTRREPQGRRPPAPAKPVVLADYTRLGPTGAGKIPTATVKSYDKSGRPLLTLNDLEF